MEVINNVVFEIWKNVMILPVFLRQILLLVIFVLVLRLILLKVVPILFRVMINIFTYILNLIVSFSYGTINAWMRSRRKREKGINGFINAIETLIDVMIEVSTRMKNVIKPRPTFKRQFKSVYKWVAWIFILGFPFLYHSQPQLEVSEKWNELESWMLMGESVEAFAFEFSTEEKKEPSEDGELWVRLRDGQEGVVVRAEPSLDGAQVAVIRTGESARFLNDEKQVGDINWLHIELENGKVGWVSNNIVEQYER